MATVHPLRELPTSAFQPQFQVLSMCEVPDISASPSFTGDLDDSDRHHIEELTMAKLATPQRGEWAQDWVPTEG